MASPSGPALSEAYLSEDKSYVVRNAAIVFIVISTLCVGARFIGRHLSRRGLGLDDWLMVPAWLLFMGLCTICLLFIPLAHEGRHIEWVMSHDPGALTRFLVLLYTYAAWNLPTVFFPKLSIVCFYYKLFGVKRYIRVLCWATFVFLLVVCLAGTSTILAMCIPAQKFWHPDLPGKCINENTLWRWTTFSTIATDIPLLIIPIPEILQLQVPARTRASIILILIAACGGMIAAIVKMIQFYTVNLTVDATFQMESIILTIAEPGCYVIASCLPTFGPLYRFLPTKSIQSWTSQTRSTILRVLRPNSTSRASHSDCMSTDTDTRKLSEGSNEAIVELVDMTEHERQSRPQQAKGIVVSQEFTVSASR